MTLPERPPANLKDVAAAAGVSVSTASRALNGKAKEYRISDSTERSIQQAAKRLGFQPSHVARSLQSKKTGLLGVIVPDVANPFFAAIAREITVAAEAHRYSVLLADSRDSEAAEQNLVQQLSARRVEALLVCPVGLCADHLAELDQTGVATVLIDRGFPDSNMVTVTSDHRVSAAALTRLLIEQGHVSIGVLQGYPGTLPNEERMAGIRQSLQRAGIELKPSLVGGDQFSEASGYDAACSLIDRHPEMTAMIGLSSQNSLGALRAVAERGLRIPTDLSLVTFDDHPFANFLATPLTTACQDVSELGRLAAKLVFERIRTGKRLEQTMHRIPVQITERSSIAPPKPTTPSPPTIKKAVQ